MLTSGSTGNAKAVALEHRQISDAVEGKSTFNRTESNDNFLNWIGLDHVANFTEIHLHAMSLAAEQVHVGAADLLGDPFAFLRLISKHKIAYTFAPNFFLASLRKVLEARSELLRADQDPSLDLSCLRALLSGGEAVITESCNAVSRLLGDHGAPNGFLKPSFGMTETCAGCTYNNDFPKYDVNKSLELASLGSTVQGLQMRITRDDASLAKKNEIGNLEVSGPVLFKAYYNNSAATADAFTADGWFITGDRAFIDERDHLNLSGRAKETIIINGVKHFPHEIESAIEDAHILGVIPAHTVVFPHRPKSHPTEVICAVYLPAYSPNDSRARIDTKRAISEVVVRHCSSRPYQILSLAKEDFSKSSLGKLSRMKIRTAFESGNYALLEKSDDAAIENWKATQCLRPTTETEVLLLDIFADILETSPQNFAVDTSLFELGVSSVELLRLTTAIECRLKSSNRVTITTIMANPSIHSLTMALKRSGTISYEPAVILQTRGTAPPLWLIHPGVGEILIFLRLADYITDRPVYAFRSRGFDGEDFYGSMDEVVSTYYAEMKRLRPEGPYTIAGYSYGAAIAFELSKQMTTYGDKIDFLGVIDQPPNIKQRMRHSDQTNVLLTLGHFLEIVTTEQCEELYPHLSKLSQDEAVDYILSMTTPLHLDTMAIEKAKLANWAALALNNHEIARDYVPQGVAPIMDVFYAETPVAFYAQSGSEMMAKHLRKWNNFVEIEVLYHEVKGTHHDMLRGSNVSSFYKTFQAAIQHRCF